MKELRVKAQSMRKKWMPKSIEELEEELKDAKKEISRLEKENEELLILLSEVSKQLIDTGSALETWLNIKRKEEKDFN